MQKQQVVVQVPAHISLKYSSPELQLKQISNDEFQTKKLSTNALCFYFLFFLTPKVTG